MVMQAVHNESSFFWNKIRIKKFSLSFLVEFNKEVKLNELVQHAAYFSKIITVYTMCRFRKI